jgi:hypothetical protein
VFYSLMSEDSAHLLGIVYNHILIHVTSFQVHALSAKAETSVLGRSMRATAPALGMTASESLVILFLNV